MPGIVEDLSVFLTVKFGNNSSNALLDTGASCSIMDLGTFGSLGLQYKIIPFNNQLTDASGDNMQILGFSVVEVFIKGHKFTQEMKILNSKSYRNVILGRDFLSKFSNVQFDFKTQRLKLGPYWYYCVHLKKPSAVLLTDCIELPAPTESVVNVKCRPSIALITADFEPFPVAPSIYATHCRVILSIRGEFQIKLLNVNNTSYFMKRDKKIGSLNKIEETVARVDHIDSRSSVNLESNIMYGDNLSVAQKTKIRTLVSEYCIIISLSVSPCPLDGNLIAFPMLGIQKLTNKSKKC